MTRKANRSTNRGKLTSSIFLSITLVFSLFTTILQPNTANTLITPITPTGSPIAVVPGDYINFPFTGTIQSTTLPACTFRLEVWGAQGGSAQDGNSIGGLGGYSAGTLTLDTITDLFVVVGGQSGDISGGFNGGGNGSSHDWERVGTAGGGATHMSLISGTLSNIVDDSILIVAGGGGGASGDPHDARDGGAGGGDSGLPGQVGFNGEISAGGGTQTEGGVAGFWGSGWGVASPGSRGLGGDAGGVESTSGGGGGGWYGGGGGMWGSGGGGSGFISPILTNSETIPGNQSMPNPLGGTMIGNPNNGFARITPIECPPGPIDPVDPIIPDPPIITPPNSGIDFLSNGVYRSAFALVGLLMVTVVVTYLVKKRFLPNKLK